MMDYQQNDNEATNSEDCDIKDEMKKRSVFDERTEEASASQYFQFYGYLAQQQNMMQDYVRTSTYQRAVLSNLSDFKDKVVLDVGAGSGILSFFAAQAGAKKVYAVEASSMAVHCEALVKANGYENRISVVAGKIEDIDLPDKVDTIISEPMGYMLLNERMLESFLHAKKFLKPGGKMYPSRGDLHIAPFSDEALYIEQCTKANFWCQESFHGVNLLSLRQQALKEYFRQPVVDTFHVGILLAPSVAWTLDFTKWEEEGLHHIEIPLEFVLTQTSCVHGLAFWFDVAFIGTNQTVWLSTAPTEPLTHWYQVRCLLEKPLLCPQGGTLTGYVHLTANMRQSYDVEICLQAEGVVGPDGGAPIVHTSKNTLDLKNPCFRYTGQPVQPPPGYHQQPGTGNGVANGNEAGANILTSPTDTYWQSVLAAAAAQQTQLVENGVSGLMNGAAEGMPILGNPATNLLNAARMLPLDTLTTPISAAIPAAAGATVGIPAIGNVVSFLPSGQVVSLSPTTAVPSTAVSGAFVSQSLQPLSPHHSQLGAVPGACLPVAGTVVVQQPLQSIPVSNYHPLPPHDYYLGHGEGRDAAAGERRYDPLTSQQHFSYQTAGASTGGQKV